MKHSLYSRPEVGVCVLYIILFFLLVDIQHTQCSCWLFHPREIQALWSQNYVDSSSSGSFTIKLADANRSSIFLACTSRHRSPVTALYNSRYYSDTSSLPIWFQYDISILPLVLNQFDTSMIPVWHQWYQNGTNMNQYDTSMIPVWYQYDTSDTRMIPVIGACPVTPDCIVAMS